MVWPCGHGMVYGMACRGWHGIWYGLARYCMVYDIAGGHDMVYGEADVSWRSCSHIQDPFTSKVTITYIFRSHVQLLFTLGSDSTLRDCEYISPFWDRIFEKAYTCNIY